MKEEDLALDDALLGADLLLLRIAGQPAAEMRITVEASEYEGRPCYLVIESLKASYTELVKDTLECESLVSPQAITPPWMLRVVELLLM